MRLMTDREEEIASALAVDLDSLPRLRGFRLRGIEMTRLETFIDAAFAFAISMLVIAAQQIPDNIQALLAAFRNVPTFVCSIAVLGIFWRGHWLWSRRYGLEDGVSILISWTMIVTILIFIYPLKAIFGAMWYFLSNGQVGQPFSLHTTEAQARTIFAIYALGLIAISAEILLLYLRAWRLREPLRLNAREQLMTRGELTGWSIPVSMGIVSLVFAFTLPIEQIAWCGWVYFLMAVLLRAHGFLHRRKLRKVTSDPPSPERFGAAGE
jgi:transmembrane protein TMEM174 (potassium channel)